MIQFKGRSLNWTKITMGQNDFWKNYTARPWDTQPLGGSPSRCANLAELQFWIGFKKFWGTRILLGCLTTSLIFLRYLIFLRILRGFCTDFLRGVVHLHTVWFSGTRNLRPCCILFPSLLLPTIRKISFGKIDLRSKNNFWWQ